MSLSTPAAALLTLLMHFPLWWAARRFARWLPGPTGTPGALEIFLACLVLWRLETLLLGACQQLHLGGVLVSHGLLVVFAGALGNTAGPNAADAMASPPVTPEPSSSSGTGTSRYLIGAWWGLAVALAVTRILFLPDPYDSYTYHLMLPFRWLETSTLSLVATSFGDIAPTYTPAAVEGFFLGLMLPGHTDALARVGQLPFLVCLPVLVADLARRTGPHPRWAPGLVGTLALLWPELLAQGASSMVDLAAAVLLLAALRAALDLRESSRASELWWGGALAGLFLASRFTGPVFLPAVLLVLLGSVGKSTRAWGWWSLGLLATGAFPFLRNLWLTGNPMYPLALELPGGWSLPGLFTRTATLASPLHLESPMALLTLARHALGWGGIGLLAAGLVTPGWRNTTGRRLALAGLWLLASHCLLVPYNANLRFLIAAWGLLSVALASWCRWRAGAALVIALGGGLAVHTVRDLILFPGWQLTTMLSGGVVLGVLVAWILAEFPQLAWHRLRGRGQRMRLGLGTAATWLAVVVTLGLGWCHQVRVGRLVEIHARDRGHRYAPYRDAWRQLRALPPGLCIAYSGLNLPYPLAEPALKNRVLALPLDGSPSSWLPHDHAKHDANLRPSARTVAIEVGRRHPDRVAWLAGLERERVDVLAVYLPRGGGFEPPIELRWALDDARRFSPLASSSPGLRLFRVEGGSR